MWNKFLFCVLLLAAAPALAHTYEARLDQSVWNLEPSPLKCRLWQAVPNYGEAVFEASGHPEHGGYARAVGEWQNTDGGRGGGQRVVLRSQLRDPR